MQFREVMSSSAEFGWRVEGIRVHGARFPRDCKTLKSRADLDEALAWYFAGARHTVPSDVLASLAELRTRLELSQWFAQHELVSTSLLFVYDGVRARLPRLYRP